MSLSRMGEGKGEGDGTLRIRLRRRGNPADGICGSAPLRGPTGQLRTGRVKSEAELSNPPHLNPLPPGRGGRLSEDRCEPMRIERIDLIPFRIPFRRPFRAACTEVRARAGLLILLRDSSGHTGIGEVVTRPGEPCPVVDATLIETVRNAAPEVMDANVPPQVRAGLECAVLDLQARAADVPLAVLLGAVKRDHIPVNATLDCLDPQEAAEDARRFFERGFRCIKIKVSPSDLANDDARLAAIRAAVGEQVRLRIDANAAWSVGHAVQAISQLETHGLDYVEQPVASIDGLAEVRRRVRTAIAADESVTSVATVEALAVASAVDLVVIKPSLLGLRASAKIAQRARDLRLGAVITSTLDTSIGIVAAVHLAATLPDPLLPCGLATVELLAGDLVSESVVAREGQITVPLGAGLGVSVDEEALARWRIHNSEYRIQNTESAGGFGSREE
jgi:L-Ala-D/L-Glu epimerase